MTESTRTKTPPHLLRYVVAQNYARYTPEDQAVWRYIMRQLKHFLSEHAHPSYLSGLSQSGLSVDQIPHIEKVDAHLEKFGWGAVPVSGFIPPAAFMEFQSLGILPIASDMRTLDHLLYTPAPDIVHEAAGHAPILAEPEYAAYLRQYGEVARHSITSKEDLAQYEAIRILSDLKEDPHTTPQQVQEAERALTEINNQMRFVSEATLLSRMNWWTAEYGLIGSPQAPKIFGAGLLSSIGEARACLHPRVKKIPLTVDCVDFSYDITEPQPQLFVAENFAQLGHVLEQLTDRLAYRRGGVFGLDRAIEAETVNTVVLDSGLQISGLLKSYVKDAQGQPCYLQFQGPTQLSYGGRELSNQGCAHHAHGFSSPLGAVKGLRQGVHQLNGAALERLRAGVKTELAFESGVTVQGTVRSWTRHQDQALILTWVDCTVRLGDQILFDPAWGVYDMALGMHVTSVFGGPADRTQYGQSQEYVAKEIPLKSHSAAEKARHQTFQRLRDLRDGKTDARSEFDSLIQHFQSSKPPIWLEGMELLELSYDLDRPLERQSLLEQLQNPQFQKANVRECIDNGVQLASQKL